MFHPAQVLSPGKVTAGAGMSGQVELRVPGASTAEAPGAGRLGELAVGPAMAPWVGARVGLPRHNEAGLGVTGRALRLDARHAFLFGDLALSVGLGASALAPIRPGEDGAGSRVFGGGVDVPVLIGMTSASDLYALWAGPRVGAELWRGRAALSEGSAALADVEGRHLFAGLVAGVRVGFRHVYAALELSFAYHRVDGTLGGAPLGVSRLSLAPASALILSF
ncbi:MAG: hypothetical protein U0359_08725 [Byssovorax sp.]